MNARMLWLATILVALPAWAQQPAPELAKPPDGAQHLVIQSIAGKQGDSWRWVTPEGVRMARETMNLRGASIDLDARGVAGADGLPVSIEIHGNTLQGNAAESYQASEAGGHWHSPVDSGTATDARGRFYTPYGGPVASLAWLAERTLAAPDHTLLLLPGGQVTATKLRTTQLKGQYPDDKRSVDIWAFTGLDNSPRPIWMNSDGSFFGVAGALSWLPEPYVAEQKLLEDAQTGALSLQAGRLSNALAAPRRGATAFVHVRIFDADRRRFLDNQTVVVQGASIAAVGPYSKVGAPAGAILFNGEGKTLLPGLWDSHLHVADDYTGLQELSMGVTSIRDPGNDDDRTIDRRLRVDASELLMPNVFASELIDGQGPHTAPLANVAESEAWAVGYVDQAYENDFTGVKLYGSLNPAWLPAAIAEAHRLGLHVHGHPPAGMRPLDAVNLGFDELTHINMLLMQAMPDSVVAAANGFASLEGPGRLGKDVNLDGPELAGLLQAMVQKKLYADPTMVAFESLYVPENGELSPAYAPFAGTLPTQAERAFRSGGLAVPQGLARADYRASWAKMLGLLSRLHKAGIPIVAGTDGNGLELVRELQIYVQAGYTPAEALAAATIVPATLVGQGAVTGSISVGKDADLVLVEGNPEKDLAALRQTRLIMLGGRIMDADGLRKAAGYAARPH
jgi:imidazolonepropionase-like amidohydrolase